MALFWESEARPKNSCSTSVSRASRQARETCLNGLWTPKPCLQNVNLRFCAPRGFLAVQTSPEWLCPLRFTYLCVDTPNFGPLAEDLTLWRFCSADEDQRRRYSSNNGFDGVSIGPGESVFIHFNDDAPDEPNALNITSLTQPGLIGFAGPLDRGPYAIGLWFRPARFSDGNQLADYVQWNIDGRHNSSADERSDEAVDGSVWVDEREWVVTTRDTLRIELNDLSGSELHGPDSYLALSSPIGDFNLDDVVDLLDIDLLGTEIAAGTNKGSFDLNRDRLVNQDDLNLFLGGEIITDGNKLNGDPDFNGTVAFADFLILSSNFGQDGKKWSEGDFVPNGRVEFDDFLTLSANFGESADSVTQIPEAHTCVMLVVGLSLLSSWRRRYLSDWQRDA